MIGRAFEFAKEILRRWQRSEVTVLAASLAFFTVLSLAPLLIVVIAVLDFFGQGGAQQAVLDLVRRLLGDNGAELVRNMVALRQAGGDDVLTAVWSTALLMVGATGLFTQLQHSLNLLWGVEPSKERAGWLNLLRMRLVSLGMVLVIGFLLLVSLVFTTGVEAAAMSARTVLPGLDLLWVVLDVAFSLVLVVLLFTFVFRQLPDVRIPWRSAAAGSVLTALLFTVGEWLLGFYLATQNASGAVSAAGSLIVLLLWVFYSAQIVLLGALLSKVVLERSGQTLEPAPHAVPRRDDWP